MRILFIVSDSVNLAHVLAFYV